jgi:predicted transposase YbfD/YdcC
MPGIGYIKKMIKHTCSTAYNNSFIVHFSKLEDPRRTSKGNLRHSLTDIVFLVIAAVVSGADSWQSIEVFGKNQLDWLRKYVPLSTGIPSHDTLGRFFGSLDHPAFSKCFIDWASELSSLTKGEVVALDGKRLRGSYDRFSKKEAIHMVSAFAAGNGLCLGQVSCRDKSNEITAIPELLELIAIQGSTVTIDAMGCQTKIAEKIRAKGADYILAVKDNQKELHQQVKKMFNIARPSSTNVSVNVGHGRVETRKCSIIDNLVFFDSDVEWKGLKALVKIETERYSKLEKTTQRETRYYISSLSEDAAKINNMVRDHWSIENKLHWMLDVNFREDASRRRKGHSAENFNIIAKVALSLITKAPVEKPMSKSNKRYAAALSNSFREKVLQV